MNNACLGILGGMGPQATEMFYQRVLDRTAAACDQDHVPALIFSDTRIPDRTAAILSGETEPVYRRLLADAQLLERSGCTVIAIPCNTAHYFVDRLQGEVGVPVLHMIREAARVLVRRGCRRVGILSTDGTIRTGLYQTVCAELGMEAAVPGEEAQKAVMSLIYDEIKGGGKGSPEKFALADRDLRARGCDGAVLGCTELSVYRNYHGVPEFYTDAMEILAEAAVTACGYPLRGE